MKNKRIHLEVPRQNHKERARAFRQEFFSSGEPVMFGSELLDQTECYEDWLDSVTKNAAPETVSPRACSHKRSYASFWQIFVIFFVENS